MCILCKYSSNWKHKCCCLTNNFSVGTVRSQHRCHFRTPQLSSQSKPFVQVAQRLPPRQHKAASLSSFADYKDFERFSDQCLNWKCLKFCWNSNRISLPSHSNHRGWLKGCAAAPRDSPPWEWQQRIWKSWWPRGSRALSQAEGNQTSDDHWINIKSYS